MIKTKLNWTVKNLKSMYEKKNTLQMNHPIQRQSGQWDDDKLKKSLLIHSILAAYPVPDIFCLKEAVEGNVYSYSVLDGKQRLTTIFDYIDGKYPLDEETPAVTIDDTSHELGNKYFTDLDMECQQEILCFRFTIYGFEDADDDLIEEIFYRLNNSTPLSKPQKCLALMGVSNATFVKSILSDKFFSEICQFSALQRRKSDDMCTLLQAMMLLDSKYNGYEYASISANEIMQYAVSIKNNYSDAQKEKLFDILDYLEKVFPERDKMLKKINLPMLVLVADVAMGKDYNASKSIYRVGPMYFRQWFSYFFTECYEEYRLYCSSGSIKKEKTLKRLEIMEDSLMAYFELNGTAKPAQEDSDTSTSGDLPFPVLSENDALPAEKESPETTSEEKSEETISHEESAETVPHGESTEAVFEKETDDYASVAENPAPYRASDLSMIDGTVDEQESSSDEKIE